MSRIGLVIMAAGNSKRFGNENKLMLELNGKTVYEHTLDAVPLELFEKTALVTGFDALIAYGNKNGIAIVENMHPERGIGHTIKMGLSSIMHHIEGCMFLVCDQPCLKKDSIIKLISQWKNNTQHMSSLSFKGKLGNPVIFPSSLFDELMQIGDHEYGRVVIHHHMDILDKLEVIDEKELFDIDTMEDFEALK